MGFIDALILRGSTFLFVSSCSNECKNPLRFMKLCGNVTLQDLHLPFCVCDDLISLKKTLIDDLCNVTKD